jgi:hypothetical protein
MSSPLISNVRALNSQAEKQVFSKDQENFNCWGFTSFMQGWTNKLRWINREEMEDLLEANSHPIDPNELVPGDIAVYEDDNCLEHTAIVTNPLDYELIHKPGGCKLELQNFENTLGEVSYGKITQFRRSYKNWDLGCT